jgi:outer membrane lipoprotein
MTMAPPGSMARWGGVIAQVENNAQASIIEVVHYPLKSDGRPNLRKASIGRFKVLIDGFIDPLVFKQERVVSVVGTIGEPIEGMVSEQVYIYTQASTRPGIIYGKTSKTLNTAKCKSPHFSVLATILVLI